MAKGLDKQKNEKKKGKSLKEKRAEKREKRAQRLSLSDELERINKPYLYIQNDFLS